jgi:hypothetical protein
MDDAKAQGQAALKAFPFDPFALKLAGAAYRFRLLPRASLGRLFIRSPSLHFSENPLPLHFLFQRLKGLVNVVVTNDHLHEEFLSFAMG